MSEEINSSSHWPQTGDKDFFIFSFMSGSITGKKKEKGQIDPDIRKKKVKSLLHNVWWALAIGWRSSKFLYSFLSLYEIERQHSLRSLHTLCATQISIFSSFLWPNGLTFPIHRPWPQIKRSEKRKLCAWRLSLHSHESCHSKYLLFLVSLGDVAGLSHENVKSIAPGCTYVLILE